MSEETAAEPPGLTAFQRRVLEELAALRNRVERLTCGSDSPQIGRTEGALTALESKIDMWLDEENFYLEKLLSRLSGIEESLVSMTTQLRSVVNDLSEPVVRRENSEG